MSSWRYLTSVLLIVCLISSSCYAAPSKAGITCYFCNNEPNSGSHDEEYDVDCNQENYDGKVIVIDGTSSCFTHIFDDGIVYRGIDHNGHSDGECDVTDTHTKCYCGTNKCNSKVCKGCLGSTLPGSSIIPTTPGYTTLPPISTTIDSITTTLPPISTTIEITTADLTTEPVTTTPIVTTKLATTPEATTEPMTTEYIVTTVLTTTEAPTDPPTTTPEPTTEAPTDPPTTTPEPTTAPPTTEYITTIDPNILACYYCTDCPVVDENTVVARDESWNSCFVESFTFQDATIIKRGGTSEARTDGECVLDTCFCTSSLCNVQ